MPRQIWRDSFILLKNLKAYSCLIALEIRNTLFKPWFSVTWELSMLQTWNYYISSPDHIDEHLKVWLKSSRVIRRKLGTVSSYCPKYIHLSWHGIAVRKGKQDEESNFMKLLLLRAENDEVLQKWIEKSYDKLMGLNARNEILQIMALKLLRGIASDIDESGYYWYHGWWMNPKS